MKKKEKRLLRMIIVCVFFMGVGFGIMISQFLYYGASYLFYKFLNTYIMHNIMIPSYFSYYSACHETDHPLAIRWGFYTAATYNTNSDVITLSKNTTSQKKIMPNRPHNYTLTEEEKETLRHEICHYRQKMEGRASDCSYPLGMVINEAEAYLAEDYSFVPCR